MSPRGDAAATAAVSRALELLARADSDCRNGGGCEFGPLHWPVAIDAARRALDTALQALGNRDCATCDRATPPTGHVAEPVSVLVAPAVAVARLAAALAGAGMGLRHDVARGMLVIEPGSSSLAAVPAVLRAGWPSLRFVTSDAARTPRELRP